MNLSTSSPIDVVLRDNLARFREQQGLTQAELGRRAGMAAASVSHFETGQRTPSVESLVKLSDALSVSLDSLVGRSSVGERHVDPVFLQASRADANTLDTVKRVAAALLADAERRRK
jgi:transcriptional regulator with XRE-family HTH domain